MSDKKIVSELKKSIQEAPENTNSLIIVRSAIRRKLSSRIPLTQQQVLAEVRE